MGVETGFLLDRRWHWLRGDMERSKQPDLRALVELLEETGTAYAVIGGVALQVHRQEPRTTLDVDVATPSRAALPRDRLVARGFREVGRHEHSDNWLAPEGTPIQFTDDPDLVAAVARAVQVPVGDWIMKVLSAEDLLHAKLRAGADPARRRSKRLQDLADAQGLLEEHPELEACLDAKERAALRQIPD